MRRILSILLAVALTAALVPMAFAADGVTTQSIAGGHAVIVNMAGRTGDVALANNSVVNDTDASNLTAGAVAAINGNFFRCDGPTQSFPGNCPLIFGVVVKDGEVVNAGGMNNSVGFTYDGKVLIDRVNVEPQGIIVKTDGHYRANPTVFWGINTYYDSDEAIMLFTPRMTLSFTAKPDATVYVVRNGVISEKKTGGVYTIPEGTQLMVYNKTAMDNLQRYPEGVPVVGDKLQVTAAYTPTRAADAAAWNNVKTVATGGRMLVQNGANVTANTSFNAEYDQKPDQTNSSSSIRSYIGVMADGRCVMGTASGTFPAIADALVKAGVVNAVSFDGGHSCHLVNDGSVLTRAGRKLAIMVQIVPAKAGDAKPDVPTAKPVQGGNDPSDWAVPYVDQGRAAGILPAWLLGSYRNPITRSEFCTVLGTMLPKATNKALDAIRTDPDLPVEALPYANTAFPDVNGGAEWFIRNCAALRIVQGKGGMFKPDDPITRDEAAAMLQRAAKVLGVSASGSPKTFSDQASFQSWAVEPINFVSSLGIMTGSGGKFSPKGKYTREQTFKTIVELYNKAR